MSTFPSPTFQNVTINGTQTVGNTVTTGGTIDGTVIGGTTPATGNFSELEVAGTSLASASGSSLVGFEQTGTGAVLRTILSKSQDIINAADYGVVTGSTSDQSNVIQYAINATPVNGVLELLPGTYYAKNLSVTNSITIRGRSYGTYGPLTGMPNSPSGATLVLFSSAANLIKIGSVTGSQIAGLCMDNIVFAGNQTAVSDALVAIENCASPQFSNCHISYTTGISLRMRVVFEPLFSHCYFRSNDASSSVGMIVFDHIYNGMLNNNCNNIRFLDSCHFENNLGTYFYAYNDANVDILQISDNKFEWGLSGVPSSGPWPLLNLLQAGRVDISDNTFTNYNTANKYNCILSAGDSGSSASCYGSMQDNKFSNVSSTTYISQIYANSAMRIFNNSNIAANTPGLYSCVSNNAQYLEYLDSTSNPLGFNQAKAGSNLSAGFLSAHLCAFNTSLFVQDANSLSVPGTVMSSATPTTVLLDVNHNKLIGSPTGYRVGIRARSASGVGTMDVLTPEGTTTFTLASTYATYFVNLSSADVATNPTNMARVNVGSASAEAIFVDGIYIIPLDTNAPGMADPFFQQTVANNGTANISVPSTNNPNRRGVYLVVADTTTAGYAMIYSTGSALVSINVGSDFAVGNTNPATSGKVNVYLSGSTINVNNLFGSSRVITVFPFMGH